MLTTELQLLFEQLVGLELEVVGRVRPRKVTLAVTWMVEEELHRNLAVHHHAIFISVDEVEFTNRAFAGADLEPGTKQFDAPDMHKPVMHELFEVPTHSMWWVLAKKPLQGIRIDLFCLEYCGRCNGTAPHE